MRGCDGEASYATATSTGVRDTADSLARPFDLGGTHRFLEFADDAAWERSDSARCRDSVLEAVQP